MTVLKNHYSCAELAAFKLAGYSATRQGWEERVKREGWPYTEKKSPGRGGIKREYQPTNEVMAAIKEHVLHAMVQTTTGAKHDANQKNTHASHPAVPPALSSRPNAGTKTASVPALKNNALAELQQTTSALKDWQRDTAQARAAICAEVQRLAQVVSTERAIRTVIDLAEQGRLSEHLQQLVPVANAKAGQSRTLSRTSIFRWLKDSEGGIAKLAPKQRDNSPIPAWAPYLLSLKQRPQGSSIKWALEKLPDILPAGIEVPSRWAADRFLKKMSNTDVQRGRMGSREIKNIRPFVRRDTSQMWPGDAYTADGHTLDAEVAHPAHGKAFRPEITTVLDIATRKAVGWSAGLAESTWSVLDAHRHAVLTHGIESIFYVDNGSGFKNAAMSHESTGFMARLGITLTHSLPYNSQARGIIERSHQSIWVRGAKELPTYMGADMDREAKQKAFKITRADLKAVGTSALLMPWNEFIQWCQAQVDAYNNRPHSALPKIRDENTGKRRNQTPNEAWAAAIAEGWEPTTVEQHEADDLFRPYKEAKTTRAEVRLFGNLYFHPALEHYHGETVRVGYDIHDASRVWVRNQAGQLICVAEFEANKRSYFPQSFLDQAAQKRALGRIKRAQAKIDEAEEELNPTQLLEYQPAIELPSMDLRQLDAALRTTDAERIEAANVIELPKAKAERPNFDTDAGKYRWLMRNQEQVTAMDEAWINYYRMTPEYEDIFGDREVAAR